LFLQVDTTMEGDSNPTGSVQKRHKASSGQRDDEDTTMNVDDPDRGSVTMDESDAGTTGTPKPPAIRDFLGDLINDDEYKEGVSAETKLKMGNVSVAGLMLSQQESQKLLKFDVGEFLKSGKKLPYAPPSVDVVGLRNASQNYGFSKKLVHDRDVIRFMARLETVGAWHYDEKVRSTYMAPILPIIQSSGTGKSRLIFEARSLLRSHGRPCRSILLTTKDAEKVKEELIDSERKAAEKTEAGKDTDRNSEPRKLKSYDEVYTVTEEKVLALSPRSGLREFIIKQCCLACQDENVDVQGGIANGAIDVTLFFDEAQYLTTNKGFLFRVLRYIVREKSFPGNLLQRKTKGEVHVVGLNQAIDRFNVTVVLAGTNSSLGELFPETDTPSNGSRYLDSSGEYYDEGETPFSPFFIFRTQGCFSNENASSNAGNGPSETNTPSEYENMIRFSRPLFHLLHTEQRLNRNEEYDIALKILLGKPLDWAKDERSCFSVLATRVQMGATNTSVVSDLVSKGYAHLTYFRSKSGSDSGIPSLASFTCAPDPVCARIAMCLMDQSFSIEGDSVDSESTKSRLAIVGASKTDVVSTMGKIFSSGLCLPAKGDVGEIAIALYLLFCGDILRARMNQGLSRCYHVLSVDFSSWMKLVWGGGEAELDAALRHDDPWEGLQVNCIQFFRYSIQSSLEEMEKDTFLESLYLKGCGIYCPTNFEAIDHALSCLDSKNTNQNGYVGLYISGKNYAYLSPQDAVDYLLKSYKTMKKKGISKGLLLLGIVGQDRNTSDRITLCRNYEEKWRESQSEDDDAIEALVTATETKDIRTAFRVGFFCLHSDGFGINRMLNDLSSVKDQQTAEIYSIHSELIHKQVSRENENDKERSRYRRKDARDFYNDTVGIVGIPETT